MPTTETTTRAGEVIARCQRLALLLQKTHSARAALSSRQPMRDCYQEITRWLEPLGVRVQIDAAGNLRAVYPAAQPNAPRLLIGSHLDTVPELRRLRRRPRSSAGSRASRRVARAGSFLLPSKSVGFSEEEGVRFGIPFIGSRALVGRLDRGTPRRSRLSRHFGARGNRRLRTESPRSFAGRAERRCPRLP